MNIKHKLEPIEHWIVDGKAYRLATENDVGKEVYRTDVTDGVLVATNPVCGTAPLIAYEPENDRPYVCVCRWKYAYIQDDSLLTPQRTPVPALGDGWFLLRDDEVLQKGDKISGCGIDARGVTWLETGCVGMNVGMWRDGIVAHCCARYFGPAEDTEIEPGPTEEPSAKPIDWTKPVRTKDGRAVRVLCTDGPGDYPVAGYIAGEANPRSWTLDGYFHINERHSTLDLENAPQRIQREYWVNVYEGVETLLWYDTKAEADENGGQRFACVKITIDCEEGEGL